MAIKHPYVNKANKYARDVINGKIESCLYVKQACQRHLNDLSKEKNKSYPYKFDKKAAELICKFAEMMVHVKGKWAGTKIILEPWQCFLFCVGFGWLRKADGLRRFREFYWEIGRKNSKSTMGAIIGLFMAFVDGEPAAETYSAANSEKQAYEVFRPAWLMVKKNPGFKNKFGIELSGTEKNPGNMYSLSSGSRFETVIGKPGDGSSPAAWLQDEHHESKTDESYDTGKTGMGARQQPILAVITTAGTNTDSPCYMLRDKMKRILDSEITADEIFPVIFTIDKNDDWADFKNWKKANPNFGVSVFPDFLESQHQTAMQEARKQNIILCKHLNVWANAGEAWLNMLKFDECADLTLNIEDFKNEACYPGLDLASKKDIASKMRMFKRGDIYYLFSAHWTTEDRLHGEEQAQYAGWHKDGFLKASMGARIDITEIEDSIKQDAKDFDISGSENGGGEVCADPWNAQQLSTNLLNDGIEVVEISQTVAGLSEPMKELEVIILDGKFRHDGNPVTRWMFANVCCHYDEKDNTFPRKANKNSPNKIDGAVATINAMARAMYDPGITTGTYEKRGAIGF